MEIGLVNKIDIDQEMQQAYLDYAMSVIVARALPDARDGLKPVHRRILFAMHELGLRAESPYKKSARIVGEVLGKYHPHGDMAVYDAMARMAQDFSMRYLLVDGQGNFGSVDGDPPAAMRYTEARLTDPAINMLTDIQKNTVDFSPNFDGTLEEPVVLPSALPNLLVNGATGIAVGMATSIPPHNLGEVVDALRYMLDHWEKMDDINLDDLMQFIQGPDLPTGGIIIHDSDSEEEGLRSAYGTGRGRVTLQAQAHLEEMERGKNRIIVTELPYMTNKSSLIERIAELARDEKIEGIADLRDESDRHGMRIVIELSKSVEPEAVLRNLYKHTPMQTTFSITLLALVEGEPRLLSLKAALRVFIEHRLEIIRRRSEYDLERARARAHILEGLRIALQNLDEIIDLIRKSPDVDTAKTRLIKRFKLSEIQAQAILDMPLRRLAALERKKIEDEYKEVLAQIKELEGLLHSAKKMRGVVSDELLKVKEAFNDGRKTRIVNLKPGQIKNTLLTAHDLLPDKKTWVSVSVDGLVSRSVDEKIPRLSGKDAPVFLALTGTRDTLFLVSESGETAAVAVHSLPETDDPNAGASFWKISPLGESNLLAGLFSLPAKERPVDQYILTVSSQGMVKKSPLSELPGPSASVFTLAKINSEDRLVGLHLTDGSQDLLLVTAGGMAIRFSEEEVRPMGLVASGVSGVKLPGGDEVIGSEILPVKPDIKKSELLLLTTTGLGKRVAIGEFPRQGRYGQGVIAWKLSRQVSLVGAAVGKGTDRVILFFNRLAPKALRFDEAPLQSRTAQGKLIQELKPGDGITDLVAPRGFLASQEVAKEEQAPPAKKARKTTAETSPATTVSPAAKPVPEKKTSAKPATGKPATAKPITKKTGTEKTETARTTSKKPSSAKSTAAKPASATVVTGKKTPAKSQKSTPAKPDASGTTVKKKATPPPATQLTMPMDEQKGKSNTSKSKTRSAPEKPD
jgi:DNA gyrase subunit A